MVQERETALTLAVANAQDAATQAAQAEQHGAMDADGEQQLSVALQQANANVRRIKALKEKVLAGEGGGRLFTGITCSWDHYWLIGLALGAALVAAE